VTIVEDLVLPRPAFELHHENGFHLRPFARGGSRVDGFNGHAFRKEVELLHGAAWSS
jgi:hypothetical protein